MGTQVSATVTIHGDKWVLQAVFPLNDVLEDGKLAREKTLKPEKAWLHIGPHVDVAFRVPAGPPISAKYKDHVTYEAMDVRVHFIPIQDSQMRWIQVVIAPFTANGKTYQITSSAGEKSPILLRTTSPLP